MFLSYVLDFSLLEDVSFHLPTTKVINISALTPANDNRQQPRKLKAELEIFIGYLLPLNATGKLY